MHQIEAQEVSAFHAFIDEETERCLARSNVIECTAGDHVLKKGGWRATSSSFSTAPRRRDEDRVVGVVSTGDVFGEMAFLLERPRTLDIYAVSDSARVLCLSESTVRKMVGDDPVVAAKLLLNLAKMLCVRLIKAS